MLRAIASFLNRLIWPDKAQQCSSITSYYVDCLNPGIVSPNN